MFFKAACQWQKTCEHLHRECQCLCPLEFLRELSLPTSANTQSESYFGSPQLARKFDHHYPTNTYATAKLREQCLQRCVHEQQVMLMDTKVCPYSCHSATYRRLNEVQFANATPQSGVDVNLIQDDAITKKTEEELFGLAKLFSEIGGLSSFFFGFSCLVVFELLESCFRFCKSWCLRRRDRRNKRRQLSSIPKSVVFARGAAYAPHCLPSSEDSPIFRTRKALQVNRAEGSPGGEPPGVDMAVWLECDGCLASVTVS